MLLFDHVVDTIILTLPPSLIFVFITRRRTYRASFYQPAPHKEPKANGDSSEQKSISMVSNPMRNRQNL